MVVKCKFSYFQLLHFSIENIVPSLCPISPEQYFTLFNMFFHSSVLFWNFMGFGVLTRALSSGQVVQIHPTSLLFRTKADCVIFNELLRTNQNYIRNITVIDPMWLAELAPHFFANQDWHPYCIHIKVIKFLFNEVFCFATVRFRLIKLWYSQNSSKWMKCKILIL